MELREPILAAQKARLAEVLETPTLTGATRQNLGWINLSEENILTCTNSLLVEIY